MLFWNKTTAHVIISWGDSPPLSIFSEGAPVMTRRRCVPVRLWPLTLLALFLIPVRALPGEAEALDRKVLAEATGHSEALANLTYLCDQIGPRLTGSKNLKRANEWAAEKMKAYGLSNVHQ